MGRWLNRAQELGMRTSDLLCQKKGRPNEYEWLPEKQIRALVIAHQASLLEDLAEGFTPNTKLDARTRILCLVEMLCRLSDSSHPLSNSEIRDIFGTLFSAQNTPSENTIKEDLHAIRDSRALQLELNISANGVWAERANFNRDSLRLLITSVQASTFLTINQSYDMQESLLDLTSIYQTDELDNRTIHLKRLNMREQKSIAKRIAIVEEALTRGKKLAFEYCYRDFDNQLVPLPSATGEITRVETPIGIIYENGYYYLESYSDPAWRENKLTRSRLDRIKDVRVSSQDADTNVLAVKAYKRNIDKRIKSGFNMVAEEEPVALLLRVKGRCTNEMVDTFGYSLVYEPLSFEGVPENPESSMVTCIEANLVPNFYRWLAGTRQGVLLVDPKRYCKKLALNPAWDLALDTGIDQLQADYRQARKEYVEFLSGALEPYQK